MNQISMLQSLYDRLCTLEKTYYLAAGKRRRYTPQDQGDTAMRQWMYENLRDLKLDFSRSTRKIRPRPDFSGFSAYVLIDFTFRRETFYFSDEFIQFIQKSYEEYMRKTIVRQENITEPNVHASDDVDLNNDRTGDWEDGAIKPGLRY